jgi:hypothetical protein
MAEEIDKITVMSYFVIVVSLFISAEFLLASFSDRFFVTFESSRQARIIILVFLIIILVTVSYMLYKHLSELRSKMLTTLWFLIELDAMKIEKTTFDRNLQEIEQYLTNRDWDLAAYLVMRVMEEYNKLIAREVAPLT